MRRLASVLLLALLAVALPPAQAQDAPVKVTLTVDVQPDLSEKHALRFEGLRRLTEYRDICLPEGAQPARVHDEVGDVPHTKTTEDGRVSITFRARGETLTVLMQRAAPGDAHAPFFQADANFCVPENSRTTTRVSVPAGHRLFFLNRGEISSDARNGTLTKDGPMHAFYGYEAPLDPAADLAVVETGPFRIVAPREALPNAREAAALATPALQSALQEAGLPLPWDRLRVRYAPETEFGWEAGHYDGKGLVTIRLSTLDPDPREGYPLNAARVLVHEAFHAASSPFGRGPVTDVLDWWLEGTARHAERHVDALLPNATHHCERTAREVRCWDFDERISRAELDQAYAPGFTFEKRWTPSLPQSDDARAFHYRYAAYLVGAYVDQYGEAAYRDAWDALHAAFSAGEGCPCGPDWLERTLVKSAGGIAPSDLYRPYADLHAQNRPLFDATVEPYLKDEQAVRDELDRVARGGLGFGGLPIPAPHPLVALALLVLLARRRRPPTTDA